MKHERHVVEWNELPWLERYGIEWLRRHMDTNFSISPDNIIHHFTSKELDRIRKIERRAIALACVAGGLSALVSAIPAMLAELPVEMVHGAWIRSPFVVYGIALTASGIEVLYLYWLSLSTVSELSNAAGLRLGTTQDETRYDELAGALARAALELPNPTQEYSGVYPLRETPRWRLALYAAMYKAKVTVTNFLAKALIRRMMGRSALKGVAELAALPVVILWNGIVTAHIVREARIRVVGPSMASALVATLQKKYQPNSEQVEVSLRAVALVIVQSRELHPNVLRIFWALAEHGVDPLAVHGLDEEAHLRVALQALPLDERAWVNAIATVALGINGRVTSRDRNWLKEFQQLAQVTSSTKPLVRLARCVRTGQSIERIQKLL